MLTLVVKDTGERANGAVVGLWRCDCGTEKKFQNRRANKEIKSCGCMSREFTKKLNYKDGLSKHKLYPVYKAMKDRCYNESNKGYKNYGGRGIGVCEPWRKDFKAFLDWSIPSGYKEGLTLERVDNNKDYSPSNCKWEDRFKQSNNRRNNIIITHDNKTQTLKEWCRELELNYSTIRHRIKKQKLSFKDAITK